MNILAQTQSSDIFISLIEKLNGNLLFIILVLILGMIGWFLFIVFKRGLKWNDKYIIPSSIPSQVIKQSKLPISEWNTPILLEGKKVGDIGFEICGTYGLIHGNFWNSAIHQEGYQELNKLWKIPEFIPYQTYELEFIFDITNTNLQSRLLSIIIDKTRIYSKIILLCKEEQKSLLAIFRDNEKIDILAI